MMASAALILVRHGRPEIDPSLPPPKWNLHPEGRIAVGALAEALAPFAPNGIVSSAEPKALQTAEIIAGRTELEVEVDPDLGEHRRPSFAFGAEEEFFARMSAIFAHPSMAAPGDERADQARDRLVATLARHTARPLVAVTHGTVLSLVLARGLGLDAHDLWRSLRTPEAFVLGSDGRLIARLG
jgi:broad specificity phosphatase PhoE